MPRATVMTSFAPIVPVVDTLPTATANPLTQTFANDGVALPRVTNFVPADTATGCEPVRVVNTNEPGAPAAPHEPGAVEPFTDATIPCATRGNGGGTTTPNAFRVVPDTTPTAPANRPTHTFANDGAATNGFTNFVVAVTATVRAPLRVVNTNEPGAPAAPHEPGVVEPFTDATDPNAATGVSASAFPVRAAAPLTPSAIATAAAPSTLPNLRRPAPDTISVLSVPPLFPPEYCN
jgi:hypothetical protein